MRSNAAPEQALRNGHQLSAILHGSRLVATTELGLSSMFYGPSAGALGGMAVGLITEYYTASTPVERIAESGKTGTATVMITGLAVDGVSLCTNPLYCCSDFCLNVLRRLVWRGHCSMRHVGNGWYDHGARRLRPSG